MPQPLAQAIRDALADRTNEVGMCLQQTRTWLEIPACYPDATAAWKAARLKHPGDRTPPRGAPVWWTGGRNGHGHVALYLGDGLIRSTDAAGPGRVGTVALDWPERNWGLTYAGWSEDLNGVTIPELVEGGSTMPWFDYTGKPSAEQIIPGDGQWRRLDVRPLKAPTMSGIELHMGYTRLGFTWRPLPVKPVDGMTLAQVVQAAADAAGKVELKWVRGDLQPGVPDDPTAYKELHFAYGTRSVPMDGLHWEQGEKGVAGAWWIRVHGGCSSVTITTRYGKTAVLVS